MLQCLGTPHQCGLNKREASIVKFKKHNQVYDFPFQSKQASGLGKTVGS